MVEAARRRLERVRRADFRALAFCRWEEERDAKPGAVVGQAELRIVQVRNGGDEAEAQPGSRGAPGGVQANEALQHTLSVRLGNARSLVTHGQLDEVGTRLVLNPGAAHHDLASPFAVLDGVVEKVRESLGQQVTVPADP